MPGCHLRALFGRLITQIAEIVPEKYRPLALAGFLALTGIAFEWLRHVTREPLPGKEG